MTKRRHRLLRAVALAFVLALVGAACSGDDGPDSNPTSGVDADEVTVEDGRYEYASDVGADRQVVADICKIVEFIEAENFDFAAIETIYRNGSHSVADDGSMQSIGGFAAQKDSNHGLDAYYGTPTPLDDFVSAALHGTGPFDGLSDDVRSEGVEKGIQNQVMMAWFTHELKSALDKAAAGNFEVASGAVHSWDKGWALYHGAQPACAPFISANRRAGDFDTFGVTGLTAQANEQILAAMITGRDALLAHDAEGAEAAFRDVQRAGWIIYSQAVIRYATVIEDNLADGNDTKAKQHQAEGLAFWRVIEAVASEGGADVEAVNTIFDLENEPGANGFGGEVRAALAPFWAAAGITDADIGNLR